MKDVKDKLIPRRVSIRRCFMIFVFGVYFWQQNSSPRAIFLSLSYDPQEKMLSEGIQADEVSLETQSF